MTAGNQEHTTGEVSCVRKVDARVNVGIPTGHTGHITHQSIPQPTIAERTLMASHGAIQQTLL